MKKLKTFALLLALIMSMQVAACAAVTPDINVQTASVQPRGAYLMGGGCTISGGGGYVMVDAHTDAYYEAYKLKVELTVFKEEYANIWVEVWSDDVTTFYDYSVGYPTTTISVDSGYNYKIEATHTVTHNGITETCFSDAKKVYVW